MNRYKDCIQKPLSFSLSDIPTGNLPDYSPIVDPDYFGKIALQRGLTYLKVSQDAIGIVRATVNGKSYEGTIDANGSAIIAPFTKP